MSPTEMPRSDIDLWSKDTLIDPYPAYQTLRDLGPVVRMSRYDYVALPRFSSCRAALSDHATFSSTGIGLADNVTEFFAGTVLGSDPPTHEELRRPMAAALSSSNLADVREYIEARAHALVDRLAEQGTFDVVHDLARPFSVDVMASVLGLPRDGREAQIPDWAEQSFNLIGPANELQAGGFGPTGELFAYTMSLAQEGSLVPGSRGARAVAEGRPTELFTYLGPGVDTTVCGIALALLLFAQFPDQWDVVRTNPELIPSAWNEALRLQSPVHTFGRVTTVDTELEGVAIEKGTKVLVMYGAANRDERRYDNANTFDVRRNPVDLLSFGRGIHLCIGVHLARLEGQAIIGALAARASRLTISGDPQWLVNNSMHGLARLPLTISG